MIRSQTSTVKPQYSATVHRPCRTSVKLSSRSPRNSLHRSLQNFLPSVMLAVLLPVVFAGVTDAAQTDELLQQLKAVQREGRGNEQATAALAELSKADAEVLPQILAAFDGANPLAANWLRAAFESIADRAVKSGKPLPRRQLEQFILDKGNDPNARRLAFEWLSQVDATLADRLIPEMLTDPGAEFRRDAVARLIQQAGKAANDEAAVRLYRQALLGATDDDQVQSIVQPLKKLGVEINLQQHFGFLNHGKIIGPFDNKEELGFNVVYPPEKELQGDAVYDGSLGKVNWQPYDTDDDHGIYDIAKSISPYKGAVMYAWIEITSPEKLQAELRLGTPNAWKLWLNGELLFAREEYHRNMKMDQYRLPVRLKPGVNHVLLKLCQNEQTETWAQRYQFQIRLCDSSGVAIPSGQNGKEF